MFASSEGSGEAAYAQVCLSLRCYHYVISTKIAQIFSKQVGPLVPNSVTTIFCFSLIGRRETIRKKERQRKVVSNLINRFIIYKGQTCAIII